MLASVITGKPVKKQYVIDKWKYIVSIELRNHDAHCIVTVDT